MVATSFLMKYLNTYEATVAAIQDLPVMQEIVKRDEKARLELEEQMKTLGFYSQADAHIHMTKDVHASETKLCSLIDDKAILEARLAEARVFLAWFEPVWDALAEEDRFVLTTFFLEGNSHYAAVECVREHFGCERNTAQKKKSRALARLKRSLFGI